MGICAKVLIFLYILSINLCISKIRHGHNPPKRHYPSHHARENVVAHMGSTKPVVNNWIATDLEEGNLQICNVAHWGVS